MTDQQSHKHNRQIVEQFSKQALPFTVLPGHANAIEQIIQLSGVSPTDQVLDVACGPGLLTCSFAPYAREVTGIDLTGAMLEQAQKRQQELGITNIHWQLGNVETLPFPDEDFSLVVSRYSFHHFLEPAQVLGEMIRVCRPGGRVMVIDVAIGKEQAQAYNQMEKLRDPSHVRALTPEEFEQMFYQAGLSKLQREQYQVPMELESQLRASFPNPGDADKIRQLFAGDIDRNQLGVAATREGEKIIFQYPISIYLAEK